MKKALYKRIDRETSCWDVDAGSRRWVGNSARGRKLRAEMRKHARKRINRMMVKEGF